MGKTIGFYRTCPFCGSTEFGWLCVAKDLDGKKWEDLQWAD